MRKNKLAGAPFDPARWPFFYGWMILVWGTLGVLMSVPGQTIGVSVFTDHLIEALQITRDQLSVAYMFGTIGSSFLLPWAGKLYDRLGVRPVAISAALGLSLVLFLLSNISNLLVDKLQVTAPWVIVSAMLMCFMLLRFFGQGVMTMTSKNMMMQWFEQRRGFATGFSNAMTAIMFSSTPVVMYYLIEKYTWQGAWQVMALAAGLLFPLIILIFFRDRPEDSGLEPDGGFKLTEKAAAKRSKVVKQFTLPEVKRQYSFWIFAGMLAMQGLYITGFTFHVVSIFDTAGIDESKAITVFVPMAVIALLVTLIASIFSDYIVLKYLLYIKGLGACLGIIGVVLLSAFSWAYYLVIIGTGLMAGLYNVIYSVVWPRYFGRAHLGAITGQVMMLVVFGSALGPILFSGALTHTGSYVPAAWVCFGIFLVLTVAATRADNPQSKLDV